MPRLELSIIMGVGENNGARMSHAGSDGARMRGARTGKILKLMDRSKGNDVKQKEEVAL